VIKMIEKALEGRLATDALVEGFVVLGEFHEREGRKGFDQSSLTLRLR